MSPEKFEVKFDPCTVMNMVESQAITLKITSPLDKSTGQLSYKQKAKFTSTEKYEDNELGFTFEYHTQVKFKEFVYPNKSGSSSSKSNYHNNKNHNSILGN
ncbi:hypothetical protein ACFX2J_006843 [Malus domestica]